jgi:predicted Zn-dependent protease
MDRKEQILQMLASEPEDAFLRYALALEYEKENATQQAISTLQALREASPSYLGLYLKLAQLLIEQNLLFEATETLNQGIEIAKSQGNRKAQGELNELLLAIEDE